MTDDNPVVPVIRRMLGYGDAPRPRKVKTRRKKRRKGTR